MRVSDPYGWETWGKLQHLTSQREESYQRIKSRAPRSSEDYARVLGVSDADIAPEVADGSSRGFAQGPSYLSASLLNANDLPLPSQTVRGRVLNRVQGGYAVAVSGYVAFCAMQNYDVDSRFSTIGRQDPGMQDFCVLDARIDKLGRPEVHVARQSLMSKTSPSTPSELQNTEQQASISRMMDLLAGRKSMK